MPVLGWRFRVWALAREGLLCAEGPLPESRQGGLL